MIRAWRLHLEVGDPRAIRFPHVRAFVAWILERDLDAAAHRRNVKPYTVSPLGLDGDGHGWFDITTLDEAAAIALRRGHAAARLAGGTHLGQVPVRLTDEPEPLHQTSFASLRSMPPTPTVALQFVSPVVFLHGRRDHSCFPTPGLVTGHHRARWNAFAADADQVHLDLKVLRPQVVHFEGRSTLVEDGFRREHARVRRELVGFLGEVTYRTESNDRQQLAAWQAVSAFARFCGTGAHTTMGLGVTVPRPGGQQATPAREGTA